MTPGEMGQPQMTTFRAAYYLTTDGQSDVCLTSEDQAGLSGDQLITLAVAEARDTGLIGDVTGLTEDDIRRGLHIGDYTR